MESSEGNFADPVWKKGLGSRIKPVIARDTTYCVSLLTGTTGGSNFAIPSNKMSAHGNGPGFESEGQYLRLGSSQR